MKWTVIIRGKDPGLDDIDSNCKIFVDADISRSDLVNVVIEIIGGVLVGLDLVRNQYVEVYVDDNEDRTFHTDNTARAPFLASRYYLEVDAVGDRVRLSQVVENVSRLLEGLWIRGFGAVAASDYEESLPRRGGYNEDTPRTT